MALCSRSRETSRTSSPARSASIVIPVSTPKPAATGNTSAPAAAPLDQGARDALGESEAAAHPPRERCDRDVASRVDERPQVSAQVRVAHEERAVPARSLGERQRLSLPATREADDPRAGLLRARRGRVARPVVRHDHLRLRERLAESADRGRDDVLLVARCDEDREPLAHPSLRAGVGGASGRTPSTASRPTP